MGFQAGEWFLSANGIRYHTGNSNRMLLYNLLFYAMYSYKIFAYPGNYLYTEQYWQNPPDKAPGFLFRMNNGIHKFMIVDSCSA